MGGTVSPPALPADAPGVTVLDDLRLAIACHIAIPSPLQQLLACSVGGDSKHRWRAMTTPKLCC